MALSRRERQKIEQKGVLYVMAAILVSWRESITITNIEMVTDKKRQIKGIDFIIRDDYGNELYIDSKYHKDKMYKQKIEKYSSYGCVNWLSIEITKANGSIGWGRNENLKTDYIIDMINGYGYYMIDAKKLREYLKDNYTKYSTVYSSKGYEDYRAVMVNDLVENEIILFYEPWESITAVAEEVNDNEYYNSTIKPLLNDLIIS